MQFNHWLLLAEEEKNVMILPWPKIKKMGLDKFASGEATKGAYLDASKFDFKNPNFEDALLNGKVLTPQPPKPKAVQQRLFD